MKLTKAAKVKIPEEIVEACLKWARGDAHNGEFDRKAIERMIHGSWQLRKFLKIGKNDKVLEVGPFFNPQITPENGKTRKIVYWENEQDVIEFLAGKYGENYRPMYVDLNKLDQNLRRLEEETWKKLAKLVGKEQDGYFDVVIASQVFNYIHFENFLYFIRNFLKPGGLLYINNVANYGLPKYFSRHRPESNRAVLKEVEEQGFEVLRAYKLPRPKAGRSHRLIVVAKRK